MTLITIRQDQFIDNAWSVKVSFDHGPEYLVTVTEPSLPEEDDSSFAQGQATQMTVQDVIEAYGHTLFKHVFQSNSPLYGRYYQARQAGELRFEIIGEPQFHALHWEALKDPQLPRPFTLEGSFVRRSNRPVHKLAAWLDAPTLNILIVSARASGRLDVPYRSISNPIINALHTSSLRTSIHLVSPGTYQALVNQLENTRGQKKGFHIIHFDVHGELLTYEALQKGYSDKLYQSKPYGHSRPEAYKDEKAFLFFEGQKAPFDPVPACELVKLLQSHSIPIVILNTYYSAKKVSQTTLESSLASKLIMAGPQVVLAFAESVTTTVANLLVETLYKEIFAKKPLESAIRRARVELDNRKERDTKYNQIELNGWLLPVVYLNKWPELRFRDFVDHEAKDYYKRQEMSYYANQPIHGFVGRDADMLQLERRLTTKGNLLLVRGDEGIGKSTLLQHLAEWWQTTNLVKDVFYVDYAQQTITIGEKETKIGQGELVTEIAKTVFGLAEYHRLIELFRQIPSARLAEELRAKRHLLIFDQLEAIEDESQKKELCKFLGELVDGKTWVLLGSQDNAEWLRKRVRGRLVLRKQDVYDIPALENEPVLHNGRNNPPACHSELSYESGIKRLFTTLRVILHVILVSAKLLENLCRAVVSEGTWPLSQVISNLEETPVTKRVVFDEGHGQDRWTYGHSPLTKLGFAHTYAAAKNAGYYCLVSTHEKLLPSTLIECDVLVICSPKDTHLTAQEIADVLTFVRKGGSLMVLGYYCSDKHHGTNLGELTRKFGIDFNHDRVVDPCDFDGNIYEPICRLCGPFKDVGHNKPVILPYSCSLTCTENSQVVLKSGANSYSESPEVSHAGIIRSFKKIQTGPLITGVAVQYGNGRVIISGTWELFTHLPSSKDIPDNTWLFLHFLDWLTRSKFQ